METLQSTIFIEFDVNTKKITFLRGDNIVDYDSNATNIYVRVKYKNLNGNTVYLTPSELKDYKFSLYTIKPKINNINVITGEVTDELKENVYGGVVKFEIPRKCTNRLGIVKCEVHINQGNKIIGSSTFILDVKQSLVTAFDDELLGDEDFPVLKQLILEIQKDSNIDDNNRSKITSYSSDKVEDISENLSLQIKDIKEKKADKTTTENLQSQINNLVINNTGDSNAEVVQARGDFELLNDRLNKNEVSINAVSEEVWSVQPSIINDGHIKSDGSSATNNFNITIDVSEGEECWIKTTSGWDLKPYIYLDESNSVVGYYPTYEENQIWHDYNENRIKIKIPNGVTKLVVNSFDRAYLEVKKYKYNKFNSDSMKELPNNIVGIENLTPLLSSLFSSNYENISFSTQTGFMQPNGSLNTSTAGYTTINVLKGEKYKITTNYGYNMGPYVLLNEKGVVVEYLASDSTSAIVTKTFEYKIKENGVLYVNTYNNILTSIQKLIGYKISDNIINNLIVNIENLTPLLSSLFSNNYENISFSTETGFMRANGSLNTSTAEHTTINVLKGEKYKITTNYGYDMCPYVLLNGEGTTIEYLASDSPSDIATKTFEYKIKENGVLYVNTFNKLATSIQKTIGYKISDNTINNLSGKKVIFFGDSITEGQGSWADLGTIRNKNDMTGANYGVGGSKYTVTSSADNSNCIYNRIKSKYSGNGDADYVILSGLVNDALQGMPLGEMSSLTDFSVDCDTATVYGAYEMALRYVLENWKGAKVGVIITPNIPSATRLHEYFDVARNVCKKYSVPFLDLYYESGLCVGIDSIKSTYYKGDDIHPNPLGYAKYINDKVEAFMKSL